MSLRRDFLHPVPAQGYCRLPNLKVQNYYEPVLYLLHGIFIPYSKPNSLATEAELAELCSSLKSRGKV